MTAGSNNRESEVSEIAIEAYLYAYPLVISELTRRLAVGRPGSAPMNGFQHARSFPDANFTDVVRPNADTLYSTLFFDVAKEPLAITVPDSEGRYYSLQMLDLWSDVFDATGSRTTGTRAQLLVLSGSTWRGDLPKNAILIRSPTSLGWIIGRTQTNGVADYPNVSKFQSGMTVYPLSLHGTPNASGNKLIEPIWDTKTPPARVIERMSSQEFFGLFAELMKLNPPHANDYPILHRMARLGISSGKQFSLKAQDTEVRHALEAAPMAAMKLMTRGLETLGSDRNGWRVLLSSIGAYGTDYRARAMIAYSGLGASAAEDAVYPKAIQDSEGKALMSDGRYVVHFAKEEIPPVRAFWSLSLYDDRQLFADNPIDRYAIGDRDRLTVNEDGSLDLYVQRESPGEDKQSNWLPAPAQGPFTLTLRLYWPKPEILNGVWSPPPVKRVQ